MYYKIQRTPNGVTARC